MTDPKIVFFDIETVPNLNQALKHWCDLVARKFGPSPTMSASMTSMCSFGYRIFGESKAIGVNAWDFPNWKKNVNDDKEICKAIHEVLKDADAVVSFYGKKFDWPYIQTRMLINGLPLLRKSTVHIDLCKISKENLFLLNNKLKTNAEYLINDSKLEHDGWDLWVKVHGGVDRKRDRDAEKMMSKYNLKDVDLMIPLFKKFRPLIGTIPNHNLFGQGGERVCPSCGSTRVEKRGTKVTKTRHYQQYCCKDCESWSRTDVQDQALRSV
jgi:DNA polymerase elongation subunit (family B)